MLHTLLIYFFFSSRRRHTRWPRDWSSDVCSSDLDWQVHSPRLIAYPLLPGEPALTLAADLSPQWHVDMASPTYSASLGEFIAQLHSIDTEQARTTGIDHHEPAAARAQWAQDIDRVADAFDVAPALLERWRAWWPRTAIGRTSPCSPTVRSIRRTPWWTGSG